MIAVNKELLQKAIITLYDMIEDGDTTDKQQAIAIIKEFEAAIAQPVKPKETK